MRRKTVIPLISRCIVRKISSVLLIVTGLFAIVTGVANNTSTLLGISLVALGLSWMMKSKEAASIALIIPLAIGLQGLVGTVMVGMTNGLSTYSSLGILWIGALRGFEELSR